MSSRETCQICGGVLLPAVAAPRSSYAPRGTYRIDACQSCGAGTTMPRPSEHDLAHCYETSYGYSAHDLIEQEKRRRAAWLLQWSGVRAGRVLDIGCMFGFLLDEARQLGLDTHGIELSHGPAAAAIAKGHDVFTGTIEQYAALHPGARFEAIFAQHVLEHVADPRSFVAAARSLLAPGGHLVICVPNFEARLRRLVPSSWGWYQVPVHLVHYSRRALERLLGDAGFVEEVHCTRGGDTLFLVQSALQSLGISTGAVAKSAHPGGSRTALRLLGEMIRPYHAVGDDEIVARFASAG